MVLNKRYHLKAAILIDDDHYDQNQLLTKTIYTACYARRTGENLAELNGTRDIRLSYLPLVCGPLYVHFASKVKNAFKTKLVCYFWSLVLKYSPCAAVRAVC